MNEEESKGGSPGQRDEHSQMALMPEAEPGDVEGSGSFLPPINQNSNQLSPKFRKSKKKKGKQTMSGDLKTLISPPMSP